MIKPMEEKDIEYIKKAIEDMDSIITENRDFLDRIKKSKQTKKYEKYVPTLLLQIEKARETKNKFLLFIDEMKAIANDEFIY